MLRTLLLASPFVLAFVVSCGSSSSNDLLSTTGAGAATGGMDAGGKPSAQTGGSEVASGNAGGDSSTAGGDVGGGNGSAGTGNGAGRSGGGSAGSGSDGGNAGTSNGAGSGGSAGAGNGSAGTSNSAGSGSGGGGSGSAGTGNSAGSSSGGGNAGSAGTGGASGNGGSAGGPTCPDVTGDYTIKDVKGCEGLNKTAPQSIESGNGVCQVHFVSEPQDVIAGVNGNASLEGSGNFSGAQLTLGKKAGYVCSGQWDDNEEVMTLKCFEGNQECRVKLERN